VPRTQSHPALYLLVAVLWFAGAIAFAATGQLAALAPPVPQAIFGGLTIAVILSGVVFPGFRVWVAGLNIRQIIFFHVTRFIGIWFLILAARGELAPAWAIPAGWGDTFIAACALLITLFVPDLHAHRGIVIGWNLLGLLDLLFVVATAARTAMVDRAGMATLMHLPLAMVPLFFVPLLIASHVLLFFRVRKEPEAVA
jgi:hypothetical protein